MVYELRMRSRSTNWNQWREINKTGASAAVRGSWYCLRRGPYSCLQRAWAFPGATWCFMVSLRNCRSPPAVCAKAQVLPPKKWTRMRVLYVRPFVGDRDVSLRKNTVDRKKKKKQAGACGIKGPRWKYKMFRCEQMWTHPQWNMKKHISK